MTELPTFAFGLLVAVFLALAAGTSLMQRVALVLLANWLVLTAYVDATNNYTPWAMCFVVDALSAWAVMRRPASCPQATIGMLYLGQMSWHLVFGVREAINLPADAIFYYDAVTYIAWGQVAVLGVWTGGAMADRILSRWPMGYEVARRLGLVHHSREAGRK